MPAYKFAPGVFPDTFIFPTDHGWFYTVSFRNKPELFAGNELLMNDGLSFEIAFEKSRLDVAPKKKYDPSIQETILLIISNQFQAKGVLPLYFFLCDMTDRQEAARAKLFTSWFETCEIDGWELYNFELLDQQEEGDGGEKDTYRYYAGLFVHSAHPSYAAIADAFEQFLLQDISEGKWVRRS